MNVVEAVGWTLIHFVWQGAAAGMLCAAAIFLLRRSSPGARYAAATLTLLLMAVLPLATFTWLAAESSSSTVSAPLEAAIGPGLPDNPLPASSGAFSRELRDFFPQMVAFWMAGVALLSVKSAFSWFAAMMLKRRRTKPAPRIWNTRLELLALKMGIHRGIRLMESAVVRVPSVVGLFRPVILVPAGAFLNLPAAHLEAVLAHELAHIRRHDFLVNLLQTAIETLLFYHPAVWWVSHRIRIEREHCCDDLAVAVCGNPLVYARALTGLEEMRAMRPTLAMAADGGSLIARIRRLTYRSESGSSIRSGWFLAALPIATGLMVWTGQDLLRADPPASTAFQNESQEPQPTPPAPPVKAERKRAESPKSPAPTPAAKLPPATQVPVAAPAPPNGLLASLTAAGYTDLSVDEIIELKNNNVTGEYITRMKGSRFGRLNARQLIELRQHGVSSQYFHEISEAGIRDLGFREIRDLHAHNVDPAQVRDIHALGFGPYPAHEVIELRNNDVRSSFFRALKDYGMKQIGAREAIEARVNGVGSSELQEARRYGSQLSIKQIVKLKQAGVL